ncbi:unnamed protein product [Jaminaea pallidilutea]
MSVYVPPANTGGSGGGCSGSCGTLYDQQYQYIGSYFNAHMLSYPSHRYAYIMWFVIAGVLLAAGAIHALGIGDKTWVGAYWTKFAPKTRLVKFGKKMGPAEMVAAARRSSANKLQAGRDSAPLPNAGTAFSPLEPQQSGLQAPPQPPRRFVISFPSFGKIILVFWLVAVPVVLSLVGADYIDPKAGMFDASASWPDASAARYGYYGKRAATVHQQLAKRVQWGVGTFSPVSVSQPDYSLPYHTWWTAGGRTGLLTNALTPFILILALKQVPWALVSTKVLGNFAFERLSFLHKWGGRLMWLFAAAHTITWSVQLYKDSQFGTSLWSFVFIWPRFRWAFVAVGFLTLLIITSLRPIRKHYYEFFYISHIVCALGFMIATALHHPPLAGWMWVSIAWWGSERITRAVRVAWINGIGFTGRPPQQNIASSGANKPLVMNPPRRQSFAPIDKPPLSHQGSSFGWNENFQGPNPFASSNGAAGNGSPWNSPSRRALVESVGPHTISSSSTTLYDGGQSPALKAKQLHGKQTSVGDHPLATSHSFLAKDPHGRSGSLGLIQDEEWEVNENGDKVSRRPSQRYGPVSEVINGYYSFGRRSTMAGIEEGGQGVPPSQTPSEGKGTPYDDPDSTSNDIGVSKVDDWPRNDGLDGSSSTHHNLQSLAYNDSNEGHGVPASSADHYSSSQPQAKPPRALDQRQRSIASIGPTQSNGSGLLVPRPMPHQDPRPALPADVAALIRPGYAFAQILPGKTLRLTLRTPNRMSWHPGQWVYLNVPVVRGWQSHPFTIASAHDAEMPIAATQGDRDLEKGLKKERRKRGEERTMVLLLRARQGFTLQLWDYVRRHRHKQVMQAVEAENAGVPRGELATSRNTTGVHVRAIVDGAYGSADRVRWGIHSSIVIVCGGSGVSFGMALLEHLCACLSQRNIYGESKRGGKEFAVQRIRFVWILREYSHLQWVASALRRCIEMVPPEQLRVDLHVTHINNQVSPAHRPSRPNTAPEAVAGTATPTGQEDWQGGAGGWKDAHGHVVAAQPTNNGLHRLMEGNEADDLEIGANDLTEFEGEDMAAPTAAEQQINSRIQKEGKLRRAHTKKVTMKRKGGRKGSEAMGAISEEAQSMAAQRAMYEGNVHTTLPTSESISGPSADRRWSFLRASMSRPFSRSRANSAVALAVPGTSSSAESSPPHSNPNSPLKTPRNLPLPTGPGGQPQPYPPRPTSTLSGPDWRRGSAFSVDYDSMGGTSTPVGAFGQQPLAHRSNQRLLDASAPPGQSHAAAVAAAADSEVDYTDSPIDLDEVEDIDLRIMAELAHPGHPRLDRIIQEEARASQGRTMVASCGPSSLSALLRRIVAKHIDPAKARTDATGKGQINMCIESFEWGGS